MPRPVSRIGEVGLIKRVSSKIARDASVIVGIGDDAAVLRAPRHRRLLFASDMLVEGVHFSRRTVKAGSIGWKALACNVSDIAAMGGVPHWAVVSLGLPRQTPVSFVDGLYAGLNRCAAKYHLSLVGGDMARAPKVVVDVAIVGSAKPEEVVLRSGAKSGDLLFVTGRLGGSLKSGRHARFSPRLFEAQKLLQCFKPRAMMDLSDGLAKDLWQMSRASRMILRVDAALIPVAAAAKSVTAALMNGEDFELLFAVAPKDAARVPKKIGACPVTRIGKALKPGIGVEMQTKKGKIAKLYPKGFRHF